MLLAAPPVYTFWSVMNPQFFLLARSDMFFDHIYLAIAVTVQEVEKLASVSSFRKNLMPAFF
jgi:hypothetical protein